MRRTLGLAVGLLLAPMIVAAQTTPIIRITANGQSPSCRTVAPNEFHARTLLPGAGPQGQDVVRFTLTPTTVAAQFYMGWACGEFATGPGPRYVRVLFRVVTPLAVYGNGDPWTTKFVIVGDPQPDRVIVDLKPLTSFDDLNVMAQKGVGGGPTIPVPLNQWGYWQFKLDETGVKTYRNRASEATWDRYLQQPFNPAAWSNFNVGFYSNASLAMNGSVVIDIALAEYDDEFDPAFVPGDPPPPPPPLPVDCRVSDWTLQSVTPWSACTSGQQSRTETWVRTVVQQPENGGAACPALTEQRTVTQACVPPPPPPTGACVDGARTVPVGDGFVEQLPDGTAAQRQTILARKQALRASGFSVDHTTKSTYSTLWAVCEVRR